MNKFLLAFFALSISLTLPAQNFSGQWKGQFTDKSSKYMSWGGNQCEYVLDLECKNKKVTGFSYTYFEEGGKRFYTICRLEGYYDSRSKYVEVKEVERTKTNVPVEVRNCFQVHKLSFFKPKMGDETLEGNWIPAPGQEGNCGFGSTSLTRRALKTSFPGFKNPPVKTTEVTAKTQTRKLPPLADKNKTIVAGAPTKPVSKPVPASPEPVVPRKETVKMPQPSIKESVITAAPTTIKTQGLRFEKRNNTILKTIEVSNGTIKIDMYDNGEVDGDSVSLFLNGKLIVARKKLTTQPLTINIPLADLEDENELVMYAENLGAIPPNTALMIVTDGARRYEVRITSDLQKSGTIKFIKKMENTPSIN
jgi:hypothetical protein